MTLLALHVSISYGALRHFDHTMFRRVGGYEEQRRGEHVSIDCHLTLPYLTLPYLKLLNTVNTSIYYYLTSPELGLPIGC